MTPLRLDQAALFDVVVPLHDAGDTVARTLGSVAAQTVPPRRVIVVDDGSSDGGPSIAASTPGVTLLRQARSGPGPARNAGAAAGDAPWIAFLDADDVWAPDHLATLAQLVAHDPSAGLVSSGHRQVVGVPARGALVAPRGGRPRPKRIDYHIRAGRDIAVVWTSSAAVRRDVMVATGGFSAEPAGEDLDLWARIALDHPVVVTRRVTALYVRGSGGIMSSTQVPMRAAEATEAPALRDLSPSVRSMVRALERGGHRAASSSIERYIDGRATAGWRGVLLRADQRRARAMLRQLHRPWHPSAWALRLAAWTPIPLGRVLARGLGRR